MTNVLKGLAIMLIALLATTGVALSQAGQSGMAFLKLGVSGRGLAMGDAMSANVSGAAATYYNPAGILMAPGASSTELMFMHKEWIEDTRVEFLGTNILLGSENAIGFSLNSTTVADIEIRTHPGAAEGTFTARNLSLGGSYAHVFSENLRIGITGKMLYQKILLDESYGFGIDLGTQLRTPFENLSVGAVLANLGNMDGLRGGKTTLPSLLRIGPAYAFSLESVDAKVIAASDYLFVFPENKSYLNAGGEIFFNETIAVRAGYQFGSEARGFSGGLGIAYGIFSIDYAYSHLAADLGSTNTFSLSLNL